MTIKRMSGLLAVLAAGSLALAGCGSDNNAGSTPPVNTVSSSPSSDPSTTAPSSTPSSADPTADPTSDPTTDPTSTQASTTASGGSTGGDAFAAAGLTCTTGTLASSGSTAQGMAISKWIIDYNAKCNATIADYGGGGSGKGVSDFLANQTDFGGSDSALKAEQFAKAKADRCAGNDAINLPMVTGPIAVAYNVPGVTKLVLTPAVLSGIFGGTIVKWNDPEIAKLNSGVTLPDLAIATVHRSEDSGTTDNFTKYLAAAGDWKFPGGKAWTAPGGTGAQGSDGVAKAIGGTEGSIGYVEWGFARNSKLATADIDNGGGAVELTAESAGKAVAAAKIVGTGKDLSLKLDYATKAAGAYPIILVTYEVVCSAGNGDKADLLRSFLGYAATDGQQALTEIGSAPLPQEIQAKVLNAVKELS